VLRGFSTGRTNLPLPLLAAGCCGAGAFRAFGPAVGMRFSVIVPARRRRRPGRAGDTRPSPSVHKTPASFRFTIRSSLEGVRPPERILSHEANGKSVPAMFWLKALILAESLLPAAGLHWAYLQTYASMVTRTEVTLPGLPDEFDGYRIVLISCIHTSGYGPRELMLRHRLASLDADLLVMAGDFHKFGSSPAATARATARIFGILPFPDGMIASRETMTRSRSWKRRGKWDFMSCSTTVTKSAVQDARYL